MANVKLKARKYFCDNAVCQRKVFTERFDREIRPYYRRMVRSNDLLTRMALELGGNTGAAISRYVGVALKNVFHWSNFMPQSSYLITYSPVRRILGLLKCLLMKEGL